MAEAHAGELDPQIKEALLGKTMVSVSTRRSGSPELNATYPRPDEELIFQTTEGKTYRFYHDQDCCESVAIESIRGDLSFLIGSPIVAVGEWTNKCPSDSQPDSSAESYTWTYYYFVTDKGSVVVRWYGESNGYYSESVDFQEIH